MEKSSEQIACEIFKNVSDMLSVPVHMVVDAQDQNLVKPAFNPDALVSKIVALFVFCGITMPSNISPNYNSVHADIEFWKNRLSEMAASSKEILSGTDQPQ